MAANSVADNVFGLFRRQRYCQRRTITKDYGGYSRNADGGYAFYDCADFSNKDLVNWLVFIYEDQFVNALFLCFT